MTDPFALFDQWYAEAREAEPNDPGAMSLATADATGQPSARIVLLKGHRPDGFIFYTNEQSAKGGQLAAIPKAALLFHWKSLRRQVRAEGAIERVSDVEADTYFATRGRDSQLGCSAARDLEDRSNGLAGRQRGLVERLGVGDSGNRPVRADIDDVERDERVLHPEGDRLGRIVGEDHAAVGPHRLAEHEAPLLLLGCRCHLHREAVDAILRPDRQRHFAKAALRARISRFGRGVLGWQLRTAGDQRNQRAGYSSDSPKPRNSTAVSPLLLGAIRASSICPGWSSGRCDVRTVSM